MSYDGGAMDLQDWHARDIRVSVIASMVFIAVLIVLFLANRRTDFFAPLEQWVMENHLAVNSSESPPP